MNKLNKFLLGAVVSLTIWSGYLTYTIHEQGKVIGDIQYQFMGIWRTLNDNSLMLDNMMNIVQQEAQYNSEITAKQEVKKALKEIEERIFILEAEDF